MTTWQQDERAASWAARKAAAASRKVERAAKQMEEVRQMSDAEFGRLVQRTASRKVERAAKQAQVRDTLTEIATRRLGVETLEVRHRDGLDFHDIGVAGLAKALQDAYDAGAKAATR